ncbi:MAG: hypothetical protein WC376_01395 [Candidatus Nanoarchaeia archaeon]|jgi:hypothetical protein
MIFEDFKKKHSDLGLTDKDFKEFYCLISNYILLRIFPNENDFYMVTGEDADSYFDYFARGLLIIKDKFHVKFNKKFYEALNFIISYNQTFHYTVLFNELDVDIKKEIINYVSINKKKYRMPYLVRNFLTELIYCFEPERLVKIEMYKSFVNSNGKYLFD